MRVLRWRSFEGVQVEKIQRKFPGFYGLEFRAGVLLTKPIASSLRRFSSSTSKLDPLEVLETIY